MIAPLLPEIERRTGASEAELGLALGAYALPIVLVSLPLGRAADALGRRPLLLGGLLLTAVGSVVIAAAGSLPPLIVGRGIQGVGAAASWIAALALVSDLAPPGRKGEAIGFALAATSVGAIGGPALGGISGEAIGFEFPFLFVAGIAVGLAVAGRVVLPRQRRRASGGPRTSVRDLVGLAVSGPVLPATLSVIVGAATLAAIDVVVPLDADERLGLMAAAIGGLFAVTIALDAAAAPIAGRWSDRVGRVPVALLGLALLAASLVLLAILPGVGGLLTGLSVFGVGSSVLFASAVPWLDDAFGKLDKGFGYGFLNLIYSIGYAAGPIAAGVGLQSSGADLTYVLTAVLIVAAAVLMFLRRAAMPD